MTEENELINHIIHSNPAVFGLRFKGIENGKIQYTQATGAAKTKAKFDLALFRKAQGALSQIKEPSVGAFVIRINGELDRISSNLDTHIQVGGMSGSFSIAQNGKCMMSGSSTILIRKEALKLTEIKKKGSCWLFSNLDKKANNDVHLMLEFPVFQELE